MLRERHRRVLRERLESLVRDDLEPAEAQYEAIAALRGAIGFERWCWPRTDPRSGLATVGVAEFDLWREVPRLAELEQHGDVTSKPHLIAGRRASVTLSAATGGDLARSPRWRECLEPYGVGDELMTICRDRHGPWGSVELMRSSDDPPFGDDEVQLLQELSPVLGALLRRSLLDDTPAERSETTVLPPATLILDAALRPTSWTSPFIAWRTELHNGEGPEMLPPAVYEIGARLLAPADELPPLPASVRIQTRNGRWATLEGAPLEGADRGRIAITIRTASPREVQDLLCDAYDLSRRERQLVSLLVDGLATKQLAETLFISPHTVQDHLKSIFTKTGVHSRRELVSRLTARA